MPGTRAVTSAAIVVFVAFAGWLLAGPHDESVVETVYGQLFFTLLAVNVVLAALAARSARGRMRAVWLAMTAEMAAWLFAGILTPYYTLSREFPPPSLADALYLSVAPAAWLAFLLFPTRRSNRGQVRLILDTVIVGGSFFLISWLTLTRSVAQAAPEAAVAQWWEAVVWLAYPVSDIVVMTIATLVLLRVRPELRRTVALLVAARACIVLVDSAFVYLQVDPSGAVITPSYIDAAWTAGLLLFAVAFTVGGRVELDDARTVTALPGWVSLWLPYVPLVVATVVVSVTPVPIVKEPPVVIAGAILIVAVLVRQLLEATANRRLLADVADQAGRDPLTGLANRQRFRDKLDDALGDHQRDSRPVGVMVIDLDGFKAVNDSLGHLAGDEILRQAAQRILGCVRGEDTVARIGGDEFALLVRGGAPDVDRIAHRVRAAFGPPFPVAGTEWPISPSVGLAAADPATARAEDLLMLADAAMYAAKRSKGPVEAISVGELRAAIDGDDVDLVYQPKFDLVTGRVVGVEALVRWSHPTRGELGPEILLSAVRRGGVTALFTDFVIDRALDDARRWRDAGAAIPVAVNVCAPLLNDSDLAGRIGRALAARGLDTAALSIEITEEEELGDPARTRAVLQGLRDSGIRIAIDDFGTGYSALSYLRDLPVDEVKLDRGLIAPIGADPRAAALVGAVIDLAHALGVTVVAEGVEDAETADLLRGFGCDLAQGFYFSAAVRAEDVPTASPPPPGAPRALGA